MRSKPQHWTGPDRICWLCCLMQDFVGTDSLEHAPAIVSGMGSVLEAPSLGQARQAMFNLRQLSLAFVTTQAIKHAVAVYNEHHFQEGSAGPYDINAETLRFKRTDAFEDPAITQARIVLSMPLPYEPHGQQMADPSRTMSVQIGQEQLAPRVSIELGGMSLPARRVHDLQRVPSGPISVPLAELRTVAQDMDARDLAAPERRPGNWTARLEHLQLMVPRTGHGLVHGDHLQLEGKKHLIGLPGSGKTTLLMLMAVWMARKGKRLMMLFPSIEVSRQYMSDLSFYGVAVGMLVGQNPATRQRHAARIAEAIAAGGDQGGFARTLPGASDFAANCVLSAFSPDDTSVWGLGYAPCDRVLQGADQSGRRMRRRLCPLWYVCGRNKAPRDLLAATVWVGHVISMDTAVPQHAMNERIRYFELIARSFDVVVFDEADMVQQKLDEYGTAVLKISGTEGSLHEAVQEQVLGRVAATENHRLMDQATEFYTRDLAEFGTHNNTMVHTVQRVEPRIGEHFANRLLTTGRMISEILNGLGCRPPARDTETDDEVVAGFSRSRALADIWDSAAYAAFYDRNGVDNLQWPKAGLCARVLQTDQETLVRRRDKLISGFRRYLAENMAHRREAIEQEIAQHFLSICFEGTPPVGANDSVRVLVAVTFMILGYQRIVPGMRTLVSEGLLDEPAVDGTTSSQLRRFVPENILGSLSGVRYSFSRAMTTRTAARNVELTYIAFVGAPRMLMHRFHRLLDPDSGRPGPAILMTSATSYLEPSPSFHIECGPHYVLKPQMHEINIVDSIFRFKWIPDRQRNDTPLRYSGAGEMAKRNLLQMVEALARGGISKSEIYKSIRNFDVRDGIPRKAALVVNGYDQAREVKRYLDERHRELGRRTKAVVRRLEDGENFDGFITPAQVEAVGDDDRCDILVFPMLAIGRGTNVVFTDGPRVRQAAIGSIYFLTRPHPSTDDLQLLYSLAARETQRFDAQSFGINDGPAEIAERWRKAKGRTFRLARRLLEEPLMASRLGAELFKPFTANQMVSVLQTIGRGMRGGCPVAVYFIDAAWAPQSAHEQPDSPRESMLVQMRAILEECVNHPEPAIREVYQELYGAFLTPLRRIQGVVYPESFTTPDDHQYSDDGFDGPGPFVEL